MTRLVIIGAGGFGLEVLQVIDDVGGYDVVGFLDPDPAKGGGGLRGVKILGGDDRMRRLRGEGIEAATVAVAGGLLRQRLSVMAQELGYRLPSLVHPTAYVAPDVKLGAGCIIYPGAVIMPGCILADGVLINSGVTMGHEVSIGRFSNINPGASIAGRVNIGERVLVGIGSSVLENLSIGDEAKIGGGAAVISDIPERVTAVGVPARQVRGRAQ